MSQKSSGKHCVCGAVLFCAILSVGAREPSDQKGDSGMFGFFGKKAAQPVTVVAAEVGAPLKKQASMPEKFPAAAVPAHAECQIVQLRGHAPDGKWASEAVSGETQPVFLVPASAGQPALAILADTNMRMQVWELSTDKPARFIKQRPVMLDAKQASWLMYFAVAASCLPGQQVALAVSFTAPYVKEALFVFTPGSNQFRRVELIEPEVNGPPPYSSFETLSATPEAKLVKYRTGEIRIGAGNYAYQYEHIVLFSPRYPQGLEILKLGIDDGNVRAWAMQGKTLWLQTQDKRKQAKDFTWTLELNKVL